MSSLTSLTSWTSEDIDRKLKESAELLQEWTQLLDKAGLMFAAVLCDRSIHFVVNHLQIRAPMSSKKRKSCVMCIWLVNVFGMFFIVLLFELKLHRNAN